MKHLTRRDWDIVQLFLTLGMLIAVIGSVLVPQVAHESKPLPMRPATTEEVRQWEIDRMAEEMDRLR